MKMTLGRKHGTYELNRVKGHPGKIHWGQKAKFATCSGSGSAVGGKVHAKRERNYRTNAELEKIWSEFLQINSSFLERDSLIWSYGREL